MPAQAGLSLPERLHNFNTRTGRESMDKVYHLIHFDRPYRHAQHYLGYTGDLKVHLATHASGNGSRLMEVIAEAGITWQLARIWAGGRALERWLKRQKNSPRLCPICNGGNK